MASRKKSNSANLVQSATILIIGGGAAGMAAAAALSDMGIKSIVVESKQKVGGLASKLACKGVRECIRCDVCMGTEKVKDASKSSAVQTMTECRIAGVKAKPGHFAVDVIDHQGSRGCLEVDAIIVCTGVEPIDPSKFSRYGYGVVPGVVSALDVERELNMMGKLDDDNPRKLAFIQCVGSRGEKSGVDYCSTVCCKYALKLAKALNIQHPDMEVSFFFMDWRPCDGAQKDLRSWADSEKARLIRSRPAEIFRSDAGKPTVRYATQEEEVVDEEFDLVILSVGIMPSSDSAQVAKVLGIELDEEGFFRTSSGSTQTSRKGIFSAGAATGPCDLERSVTSGIAAASEAAAFSGATINSTTVAVLGKIDDKLTDESKRLGLNIVQVPWKSPLGLELSGKVGEFILKKTEENRTSFVRCGALIVSLSAESCPNPSGIISLEEFERLMMEGQPTLDTVFILQEDNGCLARPQHHERALRCALKIKESNPRKKVTIVASEFIAFGPLEKLYKLCQERGVLFIRQKEFPHVLDRGIEIFDPISKTNLRIAAEKVVIGGDRLSEEARERLLGLRLNLEDDGRSLNRPVKWKPSRCLKKGVYLCGSPWETEESRRLDLRSAMGEVLALLQNSQSTDLLAETDEKKCSACLSCVRTCPFEAPFINSEGLAEIDPGLCQGCGVCVSACPSRAISLKPFEMAGVEGR